MFRKTRTSALSPVVRTLSLIRLLTGCPVSGAMPAVTAVTFRDVPRRAGSPSRRRRIGGGIAAYIAPAALALHSAAGARAETAADGHARGRTRGPTVRGPGRCQPGDSAVSGGTSEGDGARVRREVPAISAVKLLQCIERAMCAARLANATVGGDRIRGHNHSAIWQNGYTAEQAATRFRGEPQASNARQSSA
jgi:hypothetical protein